jgi:sulfonate transport system permease protein
VSRAQPFDGRAFDKPPVQGLRAIPSLAWVPLLLLWLGIDETPKIVLIAIGAFFPVYLGVASGFRGVKQRAADRAKGADFGAAQ